MSDYRAAILNEKEFPTDPKLIQAAIKKANAFNDDVRDVRDLMSILVRAMSTTPKINRHKKRRISFLTSSKFDITPVVEDSSFLEQAESAKIRLNSFIKKYAKKFTDGDLFGISVQELEWIMTSRGVVPRISRDLKPVELERNDKYNFGFAELQTAEHYKFKRLEYPENERQNLLVYIPDFPESGGILREIVYACFMVNLSRQEWSQYIQFLKGIIQAKMKMGASPDDRKATIEAVKKAVENKATVTSDLVEFTWERMNNPDAGKNFDAFLQSCYEEIEIAISNSTMMATDRDRNALTVLERNEEDMAMDIRSEFEELINDQLLRHDYFMNVNRSEYPTELPYEFKIRAKQKQDRTANANIIMQMLDRGIPITVKELQEKTGISLAMDDDEIVRPDVVQDIVDSFE